MNTVRPWFALAAMSMSLLAPLAARADVVTDWNTTGISVTQLSSGYGGGSFMQVRALARMHAAVFDAANAVERRYAPYVFDQKAVEGTSFDAAVSTAAHDVLLALVPAQKAAIERAVDAALAKVPAGSGKDEGIALGKRVAATHLERFGNDRVDDPAVFQPLAAGPGVWQQTPQFTTPIQYAWRLVPPMAIKEVRSYDIGGPPKLNSEQFARDYNEIKAVGARNSTTRTAEQTAVAVYWTVQTMIPWSRAAQAASKAHNLTPLQNARLFALLNIAAHDSQIVGIEQKYRYNFWRPYTAIRYAGGAAPNLQAEPNWEPLINTPGFPDYPSGHCITSGAALGVLLVQFPDDKVAATDTHIPLTGLSRSWTSFSQMAKEVEDARVWGGIHFRTADEHGTRMGRKIGNDVATSLMKPLP